VAAPDYVPVSPVDRPRSYESPDHVPLAWTSDRPGDLVGRQPRSPRFGYQGPDQGYALKLAERFRDRIHVGPGESADDTIRGCLNIALRRASLFGRAPIVHDLTIALTMWGFLDPSPPEDLRARRAVLFAGVADTDHHYPEGRALADMIPEATLRMRHDEVAAGYPSTWRDLVGLKHPLSQM
jgi:hypothetical protein